jgi:hypothetical protein
MKGWSRQHFPFGRAAFGECRGRFLYRGRGACADDPGLPGLYLKRDAGPAPTRSTQKSVRVTALLSQASGTARAQRKRCGLAGISDEIPKFNRARPATTQSGVVLLAARWGTET